MERKTVKQKVLEYTDHHRVFDIEELHREIRCDIHLLIEVIDELKKEGRIKEDY